MRKLIGRWLGYEKRLGEALAQRDENRKLATGYAMQAEALVQVAQDRRERAERAATLARAAHRQINLKHSSNAAQDMILQAARLLEGQGDV